MANKPIALQHLEHGKMLCGKIFAGFVETWNWLVDGFSGMRGDADVNPKEGKIKVDRKDPAHPVIRFVGEIPQAQGGGGGKIKVIGTDGSSASDVEELTIAKGTDTNLKAVVSTTATGKAKLTIDVYYK